MMRLVPRGPLHAVAAAHPDDLLNPNGTASPALFLLGYERLGPGDHQHIARIRANSAAPMIVFGKVLAHDDVTALYDLGVEDCVVGPLDPRTLEAKINTWLRYAVPAADAIKREINSMGFHLIAGEHELHIQGLPVIHLTSLETRLLQVLMSAVGKCVSHQELIDQVWGEGAGVDKSVLKSLVWRLRAKIMHAGCRAEFIETIDQLGYKFIGLLTSRSQGELEGTPSVN